MRESDVFPSKYLAGTDIEGREIKIIIDKVMQEEVGKDKEMRPILFCRGGQKGIVLNKTNWRALAYAYGDESDEWSGKTAIIYTITALNPRTGEDGPALRIRTKPMNKSKPIKESENPGDGMTNYGAEIDDEIPF